jgi:hypothetical protein
MLKDDGRFCVQFVGKEPAASKNLRITHVDLNLFLSDILTCYKKIYWNARTNNLCLYVAQYVQQLLEKSMKHCIWQ